MALDENGLPIEEATDAPPETSLPAEDVPSSQVVLPDLGLETKQTALKGVISDTVEDMEGHQGRDTPQYVDPEIDPKDFIKEGSSYVTPESTVYGQMEKFLASDSDYMKRAETNAQEQANALGMMSSSAGIGAAHGAAIDRAAPLAAQDAETNAKFNLQQSLGEGTAAQTSVEGIVTGKIKAQESEIASNQARFNAQINAISKGADYATQLALADYNRKWDMVISDSNMRLDAALKTKMLAADIDSQTVSEVRGAAAQLILNYQVSAEELLKDPEFLQLGADAIKNTLNNLLATTEAGIRFIADSSGINMDDYLADFIENAEFTTNL